MIKSFLVCLISVFFIFLISQHLLLSIQTSDTPARLSRSLQNKGLYKNRNNQLLNAQTNSKMQDKNETKNYENFPPNNNIEDSMQKRDFNGAANVSLQKDVLNDIKTTHGEVIIKKIDGENKVTTLPMEDKRISGLQMEKLKPASGETYVHDGNAEAVTGIQLPKNINPAKSENYIPDTAESRY